MCHAELKTYYLLIYQGAKRPRGELNVPIWAGERFPQRPHWTMYYTTAKGIYKNEWTTAYI